MTGFCCIMYSRIIFLQALYYCQNRPSVCITTYGMVQTQFEQLGETKFREEFVWDYIILDEGHKIKNPTKTTKGLHAIPSKNRLILTGLLMMILQFFHFSSKTQTQILVVIYGDV